MRPAFFPTVSLSPLRHAARPRSSRKPRNTRLCLRKAIEALENRILLSSYTLTDLGTLGGNASSANAIDAGGDVAGAAQLSNGLTHATLWASGKSAQDLGTLGGNSSNALAINIL